MILALFLAIYLPGIFFGLYAYNTFKADVVFSLNKSLLFGMSLVTPENDETYIYQLALGPVVVSLFWENE